MWVQNSRLSTCGLKADLACKGFLFRGPFFHLSNGILKDTLLGLGRWEEDDERNTGHIGKKKKKHFINSVGKREWVLS